ISSLFFVAILSSFPHSDVVTSWGTHFVYDDAKTHDIHHELYECLQFAARRDAIYPEQLKGSVEICARSYWDSIKVRDNPPTFYGLYGQSEDWDFYADFVLCE